MTNLIDIIKGCCNLANEKLNNSVPKTKQVPQFIIIENILPIKLSEFITNNNIPIDCEFYTNENDMLSLTWNIAIPTNDDDKLKYRKKRFSSYLWSEIYKTFIENGYIRIPFCSSKLKILDGKNIYDLYNAKDFDTLTDYYLLYFLPPQN